MTAKRHSLRSFVYRVLALRVFGIGLLAALGFGAVAYWRAYDRIGEAVLQHARNEIEWLRYRTRALIAVEGLPLEQAARQALAQEPDREIDRRYGQFVWARFYFADGTPITDWRRPATALPEHLFGERRDLAAKGELGGPRVEPFSFGDARLIDLQIPFEARDGRRVIAQAVFELSAAVRTRARQDALRTALYVIGIVALTTAVLYPVVLTLMRRLARYSESLLASNLETLQVLGSAIAKKDSDTDAHNYRVTLYAVALAESLGLPAEELSRLIKGAFLHDVGKIGIKDAVLLKPGRLDTQEFALMKTHVEHGLDIVARSRWLHDARDVVGGHHEKYDGSGYPRGTRGEAIPVAARIFAIADVFDALTSRRPYKEPFSFEEAMQILEEGRGTHFDPRLLDGFAEIAEGLHARYCGREDAGLREDLREIVRRYFSGGLGTLEY